MAEEKEIPQAEDQYFKVSPLMLFPETHGNFPVYLRQDGQYVLYAGKSEMFTTQHKAREDCMILKISSGCFIIASPGAPRTP